MKRFMMWLLLIVSFTAFSQSAPKEPPPEFIISGIRWFGDEYRSRSLHSDTWAWGEAALLKTGQLVHWIIYSDSEGRVFFALDSLLPSKTRQALEQKYQIIACQTCPAKLIIKMDRDWLSDSSLRTRMYQPIKTKTIKMYLQRLKKTKAFKALELKGYL